MSACAAATLLVPASASALVIGIADQKPDMFSSPLFNSLKVQYARVAISWDAMEHPWETEEVDAWMDGAREAGVIPLVGFGHSRTDRRKLPTPSRLKYDFQQFRKRYPWVTNFATWNEANHCGEPTCHRPQLVAAYYRSMVRACPKCTILGAELLDMPNMARWVDQYQKHLGKKKSPRYWGLHNYLDAHLTFPIGVSYSLSSPVEQRHEYCAGSTNWRASIFPFIDQANTYNAISWNHDLCSQCGAGSLYGLHSGPNVFLKGLAIPIYKCPSSSLDTFEPSYCNFERTHVPDYQGVMGAAPDPGGRPSHG